MCVDLLHVLRTRARGENPYIAKGNKNHQNSNYMSELVFFSLRACMCTTSSLFCNRCAQSPRSWLENGTSAHDGVVMGLREHAWL